MGRDVPWLDERIEDFVACNWDTDVREHCASSFARGAMHKEGIYDAVRRFLLDVIQRDAVTPGQWARLCNVAVRTSEAVREDASDFWGWLFDDEPLPESEGRGPPRPPRA